MHGFGSKKECVVHHPKGAEVRHEISATIAEVNLVNRDDFRKTRQEMTLTELIDEKEYAEQRGVSVRTIQRERSLRIGPPFIKLGRTIYYRPEAIDAWLRSKEQVQPRSHQHT